MRAVNSILKFIKLLFPHQKAWLALLFLSFFAALIGVINPYLSKLVVDNAILKKDIKTLLYLSLAGGAVFGLSGIVSAVSNFLSISVQARIKFDLNKKLFEHLQAFIILSMITVLMVIGKRRRSGWNAQEAVDKNNE